MNKEISCSRCGNKTDCSTVEKTVSAVQAGWGSFGSALYCPECVNSWSERNAHPMADERNTFVAIMRYLETIDRETDID